MSKIIAIWGCPDSGKTTFTAKLSKMIFDETGAKILCVFADSATPTLPVLFPNKKASHINSIGAVLSRPEITREALLKSIVTTKKARNIGFVGYADGENRYSYPEFSEDKAAAFYDTAASLADFIIVDCGNKLTGLLAYTAISRAAHIFKLCKPDLKAISFFSSQSPLYGDVKYRIDEHITVLNVAEQDLYMPVEEAAQHFKCGKLIIPYAPEIKRQGMNGQYFDKVANRAWGKVMKMIMLTAVDA
jgi:CO dehydrogenase nickel-insertion accessory protein CooC1